MSLNKKLQVSRTLDKLIKTESGLMGPSPKYPANIDSKTQQQSEENEQVHIQDLKPATE